MAAFHCDCRPVIRTEFNSSILKLTLIGLRSRPLAGPRSLSLACPTFTTNDLRSRRKALGSAEVGASGASPDVTRRRVFMEVIIRVDLSVRSAVRC